MKKLVTLLFIYSSILIFAQNTDIPRQSFSPDVEVDYRLFPTKNMYTFIKLNTKNGKMTQVQWGTESKYRFETILSNNSLITESEEEIPGRFFLQPTTNNYNFMLIDQFDGRIWQVQWGEAKDRMVLRIY